jgi:hypothetical protein
VATRRRRTSSGTRSTSRRRTTARRRTTSSRSRTTRRRRTGTATTFGSVFGLLLVWVLLEAPWWVKILAVVAAVVLAGGYVLLTRDDGEPDTDAEGEPGADEVLDPETAPPAEETRP